MDTAAGLRHIIVRGIERRQMRSDSKKRCTFVVLLFAIGDLQRWP
jgi:hypothetical protein